MASASISRFDVGRRVTVPVTIGDELIIGGNAPIIVQSMVNTPTQDIPGTIQACIDLAEAGCQMVRVTAPGVKDAKALKDIRAGFSAAGFANIPLVADIHFMPAAAMEAVEHVEKVRINPGNFADKKRFEQRDYTDAEYAEELERVGDRVAPLIKRAKELGRAMRIGVNHGSLSDRIMNRFGDTPAGMVEAAMEFINFCEVGDFRNLVVSMKSSNPKVMVQAYRLLAARLDEHGVSYPLHLGVTEAGGGTEGRIKGAAGIGALLEDGIGDTIRVSLTEDPVEEIPVARSLVRHYSPPPFTAPELSEPAPCEAVDLFSYNRRRAEILRVGKDVPIGGGLLPRVFATPKQNDQASEQKADVEVMDTNLWGAGPMGPHCHRSKSNARMPAVSPDRLLIQAIDAEDTEVSLVQGALILMQLPDANADAAIRGVLARLPGPTFVGIGEPGPMGTVRAYRLLAALIEEDFKAKEAKGIGDGERHPICLAITHEKDPLGISATAGCLLIDGIGDAIYLPTYDSGVDLAFTILQAVKARQTKADYVACPSCGRTLFDLMQVTEHIKEATSHLDSVTIAIMGCIVNGPGEMADADFGFVGSGPGKIDLYRGKEKVRRSIPFADARGELIELIKEHDMWQDPE